MQLEEFKIAPRLRNLETKFLQTCNKHSEL